MALTPTEQDAATRAATYNPNRYDAGTNPYGLAGLGYQVNWTLGLNDLATLMAALVRESQAAVDAAGSATQSAGTASGAATTATNAAGTATQAAGAAAQSAADAADAVALIAGGPVASVNGETGIVTITAGDVGALTLAQAHAISLLF